MPAQVEAVEPLPKPVAVSFNGYGRIQPLRTWEAVSQVDGRVVFAIEDLVNGSIIPAQAEVLRIDPRPYEIARDRAEANLQAAEAELAELDAQVDIVTGQLELEQRIQAVIQADVDRIATLIERGSTATSAMDQPQRDLITQQRRVFDLQTQLDLIPVQRIGTEATLRTRIVDLEEAERDLSNTVIHAPFLGRVHNAEAAEGEYIRTGDPLFTLASEGAVEIVAEVQPDDVGEALSVLLSDFETVASQRDLTDPDTARQVLEIAGIEPEVLLPNGNGPVTLPAYVARIDGTIDEMTGSIGIVVRISPPAAGARPHPQLPEGTFVTVHFRATSPDPWLTVPRSAVQAENGERFLYVADADDRLARRNAHSVGHTDGRAIIEAVLEAGDRIITIPPSPAILGQPLDVLPTTYETTP